MPAPGRCHRCKTEASIPLDCVRRPKDTPIWKLEASLKCRSCRKGRYAPPVHMIRLTEERQTVPYVWVHPDEEGGGRRFTPGGCLLGWQNANEKRAPVFRPCCVDSAGLNGKG